MLTSTPAPPSPDTTHRARRVTEYRAPPDPEQRRPDREALAREFQQTHKFGGVPPGSIVRPSP